ncbi:MAG: hypothetical protein ACFFDS_02240 [Candidatus Thorarchaeota archaeon]
MDSFSIEDLAIKIDLVKSKENLREILDELCVLASNERSNKNVIHLLDKAIEISELLNDDLSLVYLIGYKIPMLYNRRENITKVRKLISKMKSISEKNDYKDVLAWIYSYMWYIEKFEGNKEESKKYINQSMNLLRKSQQTNEYLSFFIKYSYAFEQWLEENNPQSAIIFEECVDFFYKAGFYRSLMQTLAVLFVIYQQTQNKKSALKATQKLLNSKIPFDNLPVDIEAYSCYFVGLSHKLQLNLSIAEKYLEKARRIFKETLEKSIYSFYYILALSHLSTVLALQGKMNQALELIKEAESLFQTEYLSRYFDPTSKRQTTHSFNLINFYIKSRVYGKIEEDAELVSNIYNNCKVNYSDAVMLTEFLLNANLNAEQLGELKNVNNASLERVIHIINFLLEKMKIVVEVDEEQHSLNCMEALQQGFKSDKMTFIEKAYANILIAQELFSLNRFAEIYSLLRKYEKQLDRIEVLEMRIYMEAFIQVGKFRNGDPLAPALHFMAIKRCRERKFSRLEGILLDQQKTLQKIALNALNY